MNNFILAIETSIKAGSLSLLDGKTEVGGWTGNNDHPMSESLIPQIQTLLNENKIRLSELKSIVVSQGPGSFTGIRIGIAAAKALALSVNCSISGVSLLEALAFAGNPSANEKITAVVSAGRGLYFWQSFLNDAALDAPATGTVDLLQNELKTYDISKFVFEPAAYESYRQSQAELPVQAQLIEGNFARLIGLRFVYLQQNAGEIKAAAPLYVRSAVTAQKGV